MNDNCKKLSPLERFAGTEKLQCMALRSTRELKLYVAREVSAHSIVRAKVPRSPCAGSRYALSPAPAQPPASHGYKPAGSSPGHPTDIRRVRAAMCQVLQTNCDAVMIHCVHSEVTWRHHCTSPQ